MDNLKPEDLEMLKKLYKALYLFKSKEDEEQYKKRMEERREKRKEKEPN